MSEETRRVLEMVSQGKVTVAEAEQLLQAVAIGADPDQKPNPKYFRITVTKPPTDGKKAENVNIRVPISVVRGGLRLSALFPGILGKKKIQMHNGTELDLSNVTYADLEAMIKDIGDVLVDVDDDDGKRVRIRCE
jgi:hypothetical protein